MTKHMVTVTLENLEVVCYPDPVEVVEGDRIQFQSDQGDHAGVFTGSSPIGRMRWTGAKGQPSDPDVITGQPGAYKYSITLTTGTTAHTKDPIIIIKKGGA